MTDWIMLSIAGACVVLVVVASARHNATLKGNHQCNVCGQQKPLCDTCGRCLDPTCNGGCIYCRMDLPFGRKVDDRAQLKAERERLNRIVQASHPPSAAGFPHRKVGR